MDKIVRIDFRSLLCIQKTGEIGLFASDEVAVIITVIKPTGSVRSSRYPSNPDGYGNIDPGDFVFDPDARIIPWQGLLSNGQKVEAIITVLELDSGVTVDEIAARLTAKIATEAAQILAMQEPWQQGVVELLVTAISSVAAGVFGAGGHDKLGVFRVNVSNINGELRVTTGGLDVARVSGHGDRHAVSESGKTIRLRLGSRKPQDYLAEIQVRDLEADSTADGVAIYPWVLQSGRGFVNWAAR